VRQHTMCIIIELLQRETPTFIPVDLWPLKSSDLNSIDYQICSMMQDDVYQPPIPDVADLQ